MGSTYLIVLLGKDMKLHLLYLAALLVPLLADDYIVGGVKVMWSKYPFIARLEIPKGGGKGVCTGSLVKDNLILTAKHCFIDDKTGRSYPNGMATFNDYSRTTREPNEFTVGMRLIRHYPNSDLALAELNNKVWIKPVKISNKQVRSGDWVKAVGFGYHGFHQWDAPLRDIDLMVSYVNGNYIGTKVGRNNEGPCAGDSGGPLLVSTNQGWEVVATLEGGGYDCRTNIDDGYGDRWSSVRVIKNSDIHQFG